MQDAATNKGAGRVAAARPAIYYALKLAPLVALYAAFVMGVVATEPRWWFGALAVSAAFYVLGAVLLKRQPYVTCAALTAGLLVAGGLALTGLGWLHMAYVLLVMCAALLLGPGTTIYVLMGLVLIELPHVREAATVGVLYEELSVLGASALAAAIGLVAGGMIRAAAVRAAGMPLDADLGALQDEDDPGIRDIMKTALVALRADSASLFMGDAEDMVLRCSTMRGVRVQSGGLLGEAIAARSAVTGGGGAGFGKSPGYRRPGTVRSVAAAPVLDGTVTLGVLAVDSARRGAFREPEREALQVVASQLSHSLQRQRLYAEMERSHTGLKVLHEGSTTLITSLELTEVVSLSIDAMQKIAPMDVAFFLRSDTGYELAGCKGMECPVGESFGLEGTLAGLAVKEAEQVYVSDLKGYTLPVLPFSAPGAASALMMPLSYEQEPFGLVVFVSSVTGSLSPHRLKLLEVLGNQSAISLKNAMFHAEIEMRAISDGLTGLLNHRAFQEQLGHELRRYERMKAPLSLIMMDIDFFKDVNDTYGHPSGDTVLAGVAAVIKGTLRDIDVAARYGGEEFAVLLVDTDSQGAMKMAERLRVSVQNATFKTDSGNISVTLSAGVASVPGDARGKAEIIELADKALYRAKDTGRNRVISWAEMDEEGEGT